MTLVCACRVIHTFNPSIMDSFKFSGASSVGRGGMEAKVTSAWDAAQAGVTTVIANGKEPNVLLRVSTRGSFIVFLKLGETFGVTTCRC